MKLRMPRRAGSGYGDDWPLPVLSRDFIDEAIVRFAREKPEAFARYIERATLHYIRSELAREKR